VNDEALSSVARNLILKALYRKWASALPGRLAEKGVIGLTAEFAGREAETIEILDEIEKHLPPVPSVGPLGLFDAETLFRFAGLAEKLMSCSVSSDKRGNRRASQSMQSRKARGQYFTPYSLASYMVDRSLASSLEERQGPVEELSSIRLLDPAMGSGRFLLAAAERIAGEAAPGTCREALEIRRRVVDNSLFGVDRSEFAAAAATAVLALYAGRPAGWKFSRLRVGNALVGPGAGKEFSCKEGFPENFFADDSDDFDGFDADGFDAIVGNPPYVAAKNEPAAFYKPYLGRAGQSDYYLLFIQKYVVRKYLRPRGVVSFVVPDPLLCRSNAESARTRLLEEVELTDLIHAKDIFPGAGVANVVFFAKRRDGKASSRLHVTRLETKEECRCFFSDGRPGPGVYSKDVARDVFRSSPGKEFRYLLTGGAENVIERLDPKRPPPIGRGVVLRPLGTIAKTRGSIFRGEEVGKDKVRSLARRKSAGGMPIIIGGESISRYAIRDDGFLIQEGILKKDAARYGKPKILLQKSTGRLVAAFDAKGTAFPQSVYGVIVDDPRIGYPFLIAQLNSRLINYYMSVMFTGYKLLQPQIEIEDIKRLPIIVPEFEDSADARHPSLETAMGLYGQFLDTGDPGWVIEYIEECLKLGTREGSALIHDLLDFLGARMIDVCASEEKNKEERSRLEWLIDLLIYRICELELEEIEMVESFFVGGGFDEEDDSAADVSTELSKEDPNRRDPALWKKKEKNLYGKEEECTS